MARYPGLGHPAWRQAVWRWWVLHVIQPVYLWWAFRETGTAWLVWLHNSLYAALFNLLVREVRARAPRVPGTFLDVAADGRPHAGCTGAWNSHRNELLCAVQAPPGGETRPAGNA